MFREDIHRCMKVAYSVIRILPERFGTQPHFWFHAGSDGVDLCSNGISIKRGLREYLQSGEESVSSALRRRASATSISPYLRFHT